GLTSGRKVQNPPNPAATTATAPRQASARRGASAPMRRCPARRSTRVGPTTSPTTAPIGPPAKMAKYPEAPSKDDMPRAAASAPAAAAPSTKPSPPPTSENRTASTYVTATSAAWRALRLDVDGVDRLARRHEQAIALAAAEAEVGAA